MVAGHSKLRTMCLPVLMSLTDIDMNTCILIPLIVAKLPRYREVAKVHVSIRHVKPVGSSRNPNVRHARKTTSGV